MEIRVCTIGYSINKLNSRSDNMKMQKTYRDLLLDNLFLSKFGKSYSSCVKSGLVSFSDHGKPYVRGNKFYFNISHTRELVLCAMSKKECGIDCETIRQVSPKLIEKVCTPKECRSVFSADDPFREFFIHWTLKESYMKYTGLGFSIPPKSLEFEIHDDGIISNTDCRFFTIDYSFNKIISVCAPEQFTFSIEKAPVKRIPPPNEILSPKNYTDNPTSSEDQMMQNAITQKESTPKNESKEERLERMLMEANILQPENKKKIKLIY